MGWITGLRRTQLPAQRTDSRGAKASKHTCLCWGYRDTGRQSDRQRDRQEQTDRWTVGRETVDAGRQESTGGERDVPCLCSCILMDFLPFACLVSETDFPKVAGESSSFEEDSSDALSPDQLIGQDSPLGAGPLPSPTDTLGGNSNPSPTQVPNGSGKNH